jgi:lipopolysaccharide export system protein LptA
MRGLLFGIAAIALVSGAGLAQQTIMGKGMINPDAPIDLSANHFVADSNAKTGVYTGNVVVHQGEVMMRSNQMRVQFTENKPSHITAQGNVVIDAPSGIATGDNGIYEVNPRTVTLTGNVVLTKDKNVMRGRQLVVNLITGVATLDGGSGQEGRVRALFSPNNNQNDTQKP